MPLQRIEYFQIMMGGGQRGLNQDCGHLIKLGSKKQIKD